MHCFLDFFVYYNIRDCQVAFLFESNRQMGAAHLKFCSQILNTNRIGNVFVSPPDTFEDSVINGEGEVTICELFNRISSGLTLSECKGVAYKKDDQIFINPVRELISNMDTIPYATRVMLENNKYQFACIQSSRGCEGNCAFCSESRFMKDNSNVHWRGRNPKNIIDEIEMIQNKYSVDTFIFCDSSFEDPISYGKERMLEFCNMNKLS